MNARWSALFLGSALLIAAACSGGSPTGEGTGAPPGPTPTPPPVAPPPPAPPPDQRVEPPFNSDVNFDIVDDSFVDEDGNHDKQAEANIEAGKTVTWTQNGQHIHRIEFSEVPSGAQAPDSKDLLSGATWEFRPRVNGKYVFFCRYHEYMMDVVINVGGG